jgi:hypothetical protein
MAKELKDSLGEQQLSQRSLATLAKALILDMVPTPPKTDAKR